MAIGIAAITGGLGEVACSGERHGDEVSFSSRLIAEYRPRGGSAFGMVHSQWLR